MSSRKKGTPTWKPTTAEETPDEDPTIILTSRAQRGHRLRGPLRHGHVDPTTHLPTGTESTFAGAYSHFDAEQYREAHSGRAMPKT